jgi:hypothetical protein
LKGGIHETESRVLEFDDGIDGNLGSAVGDISAGSGIDYGHIVRGSVFAEPD